MTFFDPANGIDRDLRIDSITVDGQIFETEDPSVFSTGTWLPGDGLTPGFRQSEFLTNDGYFQYADQSGGGSDIQISARGTTGDETMQLQIDGVTVQTWNNVGTSLSTYAYQTSGSVSASRVRVAFTNDLYDPGNGIDRNLVVDNVTIDGTTFETEDPSVFSTGTWLPQDGVVPGFRQSELLHTNGYFQYDGSPVGGTTVTVNARGETRARNNAIGDRRNGRTYLE